MFSLKIVYYYNLHVLANIGEKREIFVKHEKKNCNLILN